MANPKSFQKVIVIGAEAGGVNAVRALVSRLPPAFPAPILVSLHVETARGHRFSDLLSAAAPNRVVMPVDGQALAGGAVYVAPPDFHMLVGDGRREPRSTAEGPPSILCFAPRLCITADARWG